MKKTPWILALLALGLGCTQYQPFDSVAELRTSYVKRTGGDANSFIVPFELSPEIQQHLEENYKPPPAERRKVEQVLDLIFQRIGLEYSLRPTRNAVDTWKTAQGNCLSFVNLFVGIARYQRLAPFYVEVTDYQRWNYNEGLVVSRGHIVAGLFIDGELSTYDFLPYRAKAYKDFKPIDDRTAAAHFYNNLGAEALMEGDTDTAMKMVRTAMDIDPDFVKGINNLGVLQSRAGEQAAAIATFQSGLERDADNSALLTNLARAYQLSGQVDEALAALERIDVNNNTNPFFFIYKGELALSKNDFDGALGHMRQALRSDSELPEVHIGLIKVYLALGDMRRARHHLGRALRLDATHPEARKYAALLDRREAEANETH